MKKIIYSLLVLAMAAFTFSSCEDVPAPYDMPTKPETPELSTDGTEANPYTVADAKIAATGTNVFVKAFIVGYVPDKALNEAIFSDAASAEKAPTNILVAASADETNVTNCMPIQLPAGAIRTALNLKDNPGNLKQEVILCGNIENYFGATGLKSVAYAKIGAKEFGTKPGGSTTTPDTPSTGKGSESDPYTVAEAIAAIKAGAPTNEVYLTGIISEVGYYNETYKSLSYYISDDGKSKDMQVYSGKGLNGADFTSKGDLKVGQKVTIKGIIKSFTDKNGTEIMEVDKSSTIIKIEGEGTGGEVTPKPDTPDTPSAGEGVSIDGTTVTLTNSKATAGESVTLNFADQGFENAQEIKTVTLPDGTTVTFDANGNKNTPKFYTATKGVRVYANSILKFEGIKDIAKIVMQCDSYNGTKYVGNETATITFSGKTATYTNIFTGTTGGGVQLRVQTIEVFYAK